MHPEKLGFEDCDLNSIFKVIDKETQTNEANTVKSSETSVKSYKLPLPRELDKPEEGTIKVFSFCQIIQDPGCPKSITIVRESVTEEVHTHKDTPNDEAFSNRYRYCKEVIKPYLKDYPPDCPNSGELLLRDAIITANEEFPEYPPCYEVPVSDSEKKTSKTNESEKYIAPIPVIPPKKSDKSIRSKKSDKDIISKKSDKDITSKKSDKNIISKKSSKVIPCKDLGPKKSDKDLSPKKSDKNLCPTKSKKDLCEKKSDKNLCSKKSDKDLRPKKSDKDITSKKSDKSIISKKSDKGIAKDCDDPCSKKRRLVLCPTPKPKICIEITDPKLCPSSCRGHKEKEGEGTIYCREKEDRCCKRPKEKEGEGTIYCREKEDRCCKRPKEEARDCKRYREEGRDCKRYREESCEGKHSRKGTREDKCFREEGGRSDKRSKWPCQERPDYCQDREESNYRRTEEDCRSERPKKRPCGRKPEKRPRSEDFGCKENPPAEKSYSLDKPCKKPCQVLPPRSHKDCPALDPDEECQEDFYPPELCSPDDDEACYCPSDEPPPIKLEKEICIPRQENKPEKNAWPPNTDTKVNTNKKDCRKDCLGKLLESLRVISTDAETCLQKSTTPTDPPPKTMDDRPSENPPKKCKPRPKTPPTVTGIPIDRCARVTRSDKKVCRRKSKTDVGKDSGKDSGGKDIPKNHGPCKVNEIVKGQLVQVQSETSKAQACHEAKKLENDTCTCTQTVNQNPAVKVKTAIDAHNETLATLKCAMEDFMCKVFRSTQDAVTLISSESAKQLQKLKESVSNTKTDCPPPKKVSDIHSNQNLRRFSLVNIDNPAKNNEKQKLPPCIPPVSNVRADSPLRYIDKIVSKVDSAVSIISSSMIFDLPKPSRPRSFNDDSSKYDIPQTSKPKDIENVIHPAGTSSSLFSSLKDKIWSMFCEDNKPDKDLTSIMSSAATSVSESDEDLINRTID